MDGTRDEDGRQVFLDEGNFEEELALLQEDLLNWDCGHPIKTGVETLAGVYGCMAMTLSDIRALPEAGC